MTEKNAMVALTRKGVFWQCASGRDAPHSAFEGNGSNGNGSNGAKHVREDRQNRADIPAPEPRSYSGGGPVSSRGGPVPNSRGGPIPQVMSQKSGSQVMRHGESLTWNPYVAPGRLLDL